MSKTKGNRSTTKTKAKQNAHLFGDNERGSYEHGLIQFGASEGAWV